MNTEKLLCDYVRAFNASDDEFVRQAVPNDAAEEWLLARAPRIAVPDEDIERTFYFRLWTYRKHLRNTPEGFVISEFLPQVGWSGKYNTIPCAVTHHLREGRWFRDNGFLDDDIRFWYSDVEHLHDYSNALEASVGAVADLRGDDTGADMLDDMIRSYEKWESERLGALGLYWSNDDRDGSEYSVTGPGLRLTLNSYQYGNARAITRIARSVGRMDVEARFGEKAERLKENINARLWNEEKQFYIPIPQRSAQDEPFEDERRNARELFGYLPWVFGLAPKGRSAAFRQLFDSNGFAGRYGLTTVERRSPQFGLFYTGEDLRRWLLERGDRPCGALGHECLWNGPVWPFATSFALTACAELLAGEEQTDLTADGYVQLLRIYAASHLRVTEDGRTIPWIDENMNPDTGDWISRTRLMDWGGKRFAEEKGGYERGKDYNHSTFCDLVLGGLFGIRPDGESVRVVPLFPAEWDYARAENIAVHGKDLSIRYARDRGYEVAVNGSVRFAASKPTPCILDC